MKTHVSSRDSGVVRWQQLSVERLRQVLRYLQRLPAVAARPDALASIPIRAVQPHVARRPYRRTGRD